MMKPLSEFVFNGQRIPERMHGGIMRYVEQGIEPGDFLSAVICNNLRGAVGCADDENIRLLPVYVAYFYNETPSGCWGSPARFYSWMKERAAIVDNPREGP